MRLKTNIAFLLVGLLLVGLLAACGADATPTPTQAASAQPAAPVPTQVVSEAPSVTAPTETTAPAETTGPTMAKEDPVLGGIWDYDRSVPKFHDPYDLRGPSDLNIWNGIIQMKFPMDPIKGIEFEPTLAAEYTVSADGTKWRIKLRQGVTWHDGEVFNADDVVATTQRLLDTDFLLKPSKVAMRSVWAGVKKIDDYTVELDTGTPDATALTFLRSYEFPMVPGHLITGSDPTSSDVEKRWKLMGPGEDQSGTFSVGTGPFMVTDWKLDTYLTAKKNPNYFKFDEAGGRLPYMDGMKYHHIADPIRRLAHFVSGGSEYSMGAGAGMSSRDANALCRQARFDCNTLEWAHGWIVTFGNHKEPAFQNSKVKTALRYGNDMDYVVNTSYAGGSSWMWVDREYYPDSTLDSKEQYELLPWSNPSRRAEFDQKAKELMTEAGYPDGVDLPYPYYTTGVGRAGFKGCYGSFLDQYSRHMDEIYNIGFKTILECREGVDHVGATQAGQWSIMSHSQPIVYIDPGTGVIQTGLKNSGLIAGIPWNWPGVEQSDAAYRVIQKTLDTSKQNELYKDYERMMANPELILMPNFYSRVLMSVPDCVHNYRPGGVWFTHLFALERVWLTGDCRN